jgi:hypothetical protein
MKTIAVGVPSGFNIPIVFMATYPRAVRGYIKKCTLLNIRGTNTVTARNKIVYQFLANKDYTHLFFMDSDMTFPEYTLKRLLERNCDIVGGFYLRKRKNFTSTSFVLGARPGGKYVTHNHNDFREVEGVGTGCLLIRRKVLEDIPCPWFEYKWTGDDDGHMFTEDLIFCEKAKARGYKIFCDGTIQCGHIGTMEVLPSKKIGKINLRAL